MRNIKQIVKNITKMIMKQKKILLLSLVVVLGAIFYFKPELYRMENFTVGTGDIGLSQVKYTGYYNDVFEFFNDETKTKVDEGVVSKIELTNVPVDTSYMWTGYVTAPATGEYTFELTSDDASHLFINDELVIDNGTVHSSTTKTGTKTLEQMKTYPVKLYYGNVAAIGTMTLKWKGGPQAEFTTDLSTLFSVVNVEQKIAEEKEAALKAEVEAEVTAKLTAEAEQKAAEEKKAAEEAAAAAAKTRRNWIIALSVIGSLLLAGGLFYYFYRRQPQITQRFQNLGQKFQGLGQKFQGLGQKFQRFRRP